METGKPFAQASGSAAGTQGLKVTESFDSGGAFVNPSCKVFDYSRHNGVAISSLSLGP